MEIMDHCFEMSLLLDGIIMTMTQRMSHQYQNQMTCAKKENIQQALSTIKLQPSRYMVVGILFVLTLYLNSM